MGWDIAPLGLKHRVDTSSMESIARFLMENFQANVSFSRREMTQDRSFRVQDDVMAFPCEGASQKISIIEDKTGHMGGRDNWELFFDWNPFPCHDETCEVSIMLYADVANLEFVDIPFRWFGFLRNFVEHDVDEEYDTFCREALDKFRRSLKEYARVFGIEKVMYIADQGLGEYILNSVDRSNAKSLMCYRKEALDVPKFLSEGQDLIRQGKEEGYLDILFDDFRDIV